VKTPFAWLAERVTLGPRALRWGTTAALVTSVLIVLGGAVVRVTGSGLGCPTWPTCDGVSVVLPLSQDIHTIIEQTNRALTGVLVVAVGWAIVAARLQAPRNRAITRLAWSQFWLVVANAVAGGVSVWVKLDPWVVALHFVLAIGLLATTTLTFHRVRSAGEEIARPRPLLRGLSVGLVASTLALILLGTLVTGSGPHSGDSVAVFRMPFNLFWITASHGALGTAVILLAVVLLAVLRRDRNVAAARRVVAFLIVAALQALLGFAQARLGLPEWMVALHVVGSALVWIGALRVLLDVNPDVFSTVRGSASMRADATPAHVDA
jgi:cytochrome c oxidase assembly protein subunit 15